MDWRPIETAPRDGTLIELGAPDEGYTVLGRWDPNGFNPAVSRKPGIWLCGGMTWCEDDDHGPTHWRAIKAES